MASRTSADQDRLICMHDSRIVNLVGVRKYLALEYFCTSQTVFGISNIAFLQGFHPFRQLQLIYVYYINTRTLRLF